MNYFLLVLFFFLSACSSLPKVAKECADIPESKARYCIYQYGKSPDKTLWYFHGLLGSVKILEPSIYDDPGLRNVVLGLHDVNVVVVSYGLGWMLVPDDAKGEYKLSDFKTKVVPYLEKKLSLKKPYYGLGHSMGGANLLSVVHGMPLFFEKVVYSNPMIVEESKNPFKLLQDCPACMMIRANYSRVDWQKYSPFKIKFDKIPKSLIVACKKDEFGLYGGAKALSEKLNIRFSESANCMHTTMNSKVILEHFLGDYYENTRL